MKARFGHRERAACRSRDGCQNMRRLSVVQMVTSYNSGCSQRYLPQLATETDVERFTRLSGAINKDYH